MTSTSSQMNICLNDLPKDIINIIGLFVNISTLLIISKKFNEFKYSLTSVPYCYSRFASDYNKSITKEIIGCFALDKLYEYKNLKSISFDNNFNQHIKKGVLPEGLVSLYFGRDFTNGRMAFKKGDLPESLLTLVFGDRFTNGDKPIYSDLPESLWYLSFGKDFTNAEHPIKKYDLPEGLLYLSFGDKFSNGGKPINGQLPKGLKSLLFGGIVDNVFGGIVDSISFRNVDKYLDPLEQGDFSEKLKIFNKYVDIVNMSFFDNGGQSIKEGDLPEGLLTLVLGDKFTNGGQQISGDLPKNLKFLVLGNKFNNRGQPIRRGDLPVNLKYLCFGFQFNSHIKAGLPDNLKCLSFGNLFKRDIEEGDLPANLKYLSFRNSLKSLKLKLNGEPIKEGDLPKKLIFLNTVPNFTNSNQIIEHTIQFL